MKATEPLVLFDALAGDDVIVGVPDGGTVSRVHVQLVEAPVLPAASAMRTWNVCEPSASTPVWSGVVHANQAPVSSLHWKVSGDVAPANAKVALATFVGFAGFVDSVGEEAGGEAAQGRVAG